MVWLVIIIGLLNVTVGFAVAIYVDRLRKAPAPSELMQKKPVAPPKVRPAPKPAHVPDDGPMLADDDAPPTEEIPDEWLEQLESENIVANSFVEASVQVLRLEVGKYRDRLIELDKRIRGCLYNGESKELGGVLADLKKTNQEWLAQQADAADHLSSKTGNLGTFKELGGMLEETLLEQTAQIETTCSNIDHLDFESDLSAGCRRLIGETRKLIDLAHLLRDRMQESLLTVVQAENRLPELDKNLLFDSLTGVHNRTGLERLFDDLWRDDPNRVCQISCAMIDIDRFARLLERFGAVACDKLLASFASFFEEMVQGDRGQDVVARFDGQRFVTFMADTGPRAATSTIEQIRQTIAESTFELGGDEFELTISCGVTEVLNDDTTDTLYQRLRRAVRAAKKQGRNRTCLDEGTGPEAVDPPEFEVTGRIIRVS